MRAGLLFAVVLLAGCLDPSAPAGMTPASAPTDRDGRTQAVSSATSPTDGPRASVVVALVDSGINPYHQAFRRPELVREPCTYLPGFPCGLPPLALTLDAPSWQEAFDADRATWAAVNKDTWYWIPGTAFVAVLCAAPMAGGLVRPETGGLCILADGDPHGAGTSGSVIQENPDALLVAIEGLPHHRLAAREKAIPVDIWSISFGPPVPAPVPDFDDPTGGQIKGPDTNFGDVVEVWSAPNAPSPAWWSWDNGDPDVIVVGGAYADDDTWEAESGVQPDVVSYWVRAAPAANHQTAMETYSGTSFATPTVAGALSKALLEVRRASGYTGLNVGGILDPIAGVTVQTLREAMNETATYTPEPRHDERRLYSLGVPVPSQAPWVQWGWGFYDAAQANRTADVLLGRAEAQEPSAIAQAYMDAVMAGRRALFR